MQKKVIAFANHSLANGGAERVISLLSSHFAEAGYITLLICNIKADWEYPVSKNVQRFFLNENTSKFRPIAAIQRIWRLRQICKKERVEVLVGFMSMSEYSVYATCGIRTKNIISIRNDPDMLYPGHMKKMYTRFLLSKADGAVFQTEEAKNWFPNKLQKKSTIIFNPIGESFYQKAHKPVPNLLVATGRLHAQKNYPMLLSAFAIVRNDINDAHLEIYGKGYLEKELKNLTEKLKLGNSVVFKGQTDDIPSALSKADVFVLASNFEGMPNSLMEAMAMGIPCVATDSPCGGSRMLIGKSQRGILVPVNDKNAFAHAIVTLLKQKDLKNQLGNEAKEFATRFSLKNVAKEWESYIFQLIK